MSITVMLTSNVRNHGWPGLWPYMERAHTHHDACLRAHATGTKAQTSHVLSVFVHHRLTISVTINESSNCAAGLSCRATDTHREGTAVLGLTAEGTVPDKVNN